MIDRLGCDGVIDYHLKGCNTVEYSKGYLTKMEQVFRGFQPNERFAFVSD